MVVHVQLHRHSQLLSQCTTYGVNVEWGPHSPGKMTTRGPPKHRENGDPTHRRFDPRTLEFSCSLEQFNAITLQFIISYTLKKASCLHYYQFHTPA